MAETLRLGTTGRRLDVLAVQQGIEKECPLRPGLFVTVLPAGTFNPRFARAIQARLERLAAKKEQEGAQPSTRFEEDPEFVVDALVASMRGIYAGDGSEVAYTPAVGLQVLADPGNADVTVWICNEAHDYGRFYEQGVEADAKNSSPGSNGKQVGAGESERTPS